MKERIIKLRNGKIAVKIKKILSSKAFPILTAAIALFSYYLGLEMLAIWYFSLCGTAMIFLCDDATPLICLLLFPAVIISEKHSPSPFYGSDYFFKTSVLVQIIIAIAIISIASVVKIITRAIGGGFRLTPMFFGLCAFGAALMFNGVFSPSYYSLGTAYGAFLAFLFVGVFVCISCFEKLPDDAVEKISLSFALLGCVLIVQLVEAYITTEGLILNGIITRSLLTFGWATYNNFGALLVMCIPPAVYLSGKKEYGVPFMAFAVLLTIASVFSMSRQSVLAAVVIFAASAVWVLVKGKNRLPNAIVVGFALLISSLILAVKWDFIIKFFSLLDIDFDSGSGRLDLWRLAWRNFLSAPVFGTGFYADLDFMNAAGMDIIPKMYHNTVMQLLGACGFVGLIAYGAHRAQTVISYVKNIKPERTCIVLIVSALLIVSLLDNHIFYLFPTLIYSMLISLLDKTGIKIEQNSANDAEKEN